MIKLRRTVLLSRGNNMDMIKKAAGMDVDAVVLDLEDGVPPHEKEKARENICEAFRTLDFGKKERIVRVNDFSSKYFLDDFIRVVSSTNVDCIMIPKVNNAKDVEFADRLLNTVEKGRKTEIIATIETAQGLVHVEEIAAACSSRVTALFFGSGDYSIDTKGEITEQSLLYPRSRIVAAAAAAGIEAIDAPYFLDVKNIEATRLDAQAAKNLGFSGKLVFHPIQIPSITEVFTPSQEELFRAKEIIDEFEKVAGAGVGVFLKGTEFIAIDTVKMLQRKVLIGKQLGLI